MNQRLNSKVIKKQKEKICPNQIQHVVENPSDYNHFFLAPTQKWKLKKTKKSKKKSVL